MAPSETARIRQVQLQPEKPRISFAAVSNLRVHDNRFALKGDHMAAFDRRLLLQHIAP